MPLNAVEQLLSDTADHFENGLETYAVTREELETMLGAGQAPHVLRVLKAVRGAELVIAVRKSEV